MECKLKNTDYRITLHFINFTINVSLYKQYWCFYSIDLCINTHSRTISFLISTTHKIIYKSGIGENIRSHKISHYLWATILETSTNLLKKSSCNEGFFMESYNLEDLPMNNEIWYLRGELVFGKTSRSCQLTLVAINYLTFVTLITIWVYPSNFQEQIFINCWDTFYWKIYFIILIFIFSSTTCKKNANT